jgi:hypothetical protein
MEKLGCKVTIYLLLCSFCRIKKIINYPFSLNSPYTFGLQLRDCHVTCIVHVLGCFVCVVKSSVSAYVNRVGEWLNIMIS